MASRASVPSPKAVEPGIRLTGRAQLKLVHFPVSHSTNCMYLQVIVPVAIPFPQPDGLKMNPFPVVRANGSLFPWGFHRVVLDQLPVLNVGHINAVRLQQWLDLHLGSQLSQRNNDTLMDPAHPDVLANIKRAIYSIIERATGMEGGRPVRVFSLQLVDGARTANRMPVLEVHTILFIDKVRFDVAAHAMVCDTFVVHTSAIAPHAASALSEVYRQGFLPVSVWTAATMRAWKQMLRALTERCRTTWTHNANCEYVAQGKIPLALGTSEGDPLCSCGRGKDVEGMMKDGVWHKFAPYATRIALSPIFPVPYIEDILWPGELPQSPRDEATSTSSAHLIDHAAPSPAHTNGSNGKETTGNAVSELGAARYDRCKKKESAGLKLLVCSRCKTAVYCSRECQKSDWKAHKLRCHN